MLRALLYLFSFVYATSYTTINIDGTEDFANDEEFSTETVGWTNYFTWDASNLYFGVAGNDIDANGKVAFIYIDTDPNANPTGGTGSTSSINWNRTHTLPFSANYAFIHKTADGGNYYNLRKYDSGWQDNQSFWRCFPWH